MRAERLTRAPEDGGRIDEDSLALDERLGVLNDRKSAKDGSVSLLSGEAEEAIRVAGGLCTGRFAANILTSGLDYTSLREGARLNIGETELEITRVGKPCFDECALFQQGEPCPLPTSCAFARVLCGGTINQFDEITILER